MNYEDLLQEMTGPQKELKDAAALAGRQQKKIAKNIEEGNLSEAKKNLQLLADAAQELARATAAVTELAGGFDSRAYFKDGDFTKQFLEKCAEKNIDVQGEKGVYEIFPYRVRIYGDDEHEEEVYINRKKVQSIRPETVAETIRTGQEKLYRMKFNATSFMNELAEAYDLSVLKSGARPGANQSLTKVYKMLVPMARSRREYDAQAFAFDLARIYEMGDEAWVTKTGRRFTFNTSRDGKSGIRVLSSAGVESFIANIRPMATDEE